MLLARVVLPEKNARGSPSWILGSTWANTLLANPPASPLPLHRCLPLLLPVVVLIIVPQSLHRLCPLFSSLSPPPPPAALPDLFLCVYPYLLLRQCAHGDGMKQRISLTEFPVAISTYYFLFQNLLRYRCIHIWWENLPHLHRDHGLRYPHLP